MWTKVWLLLGRESELPNPGDWQMEPVGREEILMVRQADGGVKGILQHLPASRQSAGRRRQRQRSKVCV